MFYRYYDPTYLLVIIGAILGFLIAIVRTNHDRNGGLSILNAVCKVYLTVIRGTPVMIQLLIIYYECKTPSGVNVMTKQ